jgi:protein-disulfide isomerase
VLEYSDYLCPFCFRHTTETSPALLEQYAGGGDFNFVFIDLPLVSLHPTAPRGHQAALCVAEQGAAFFWAYHDSLFFNQSQWSSLPDPTEYLAQTAEALGVDANAYGECMDSGRTVPTVDERVAQGTSIGFSGTPSFQFLDNASGDVYELVGAFPLETFQGYLDAMVAGEAPPEEGAGDEDPPELPLWANEEGLAPDPARPGYTVAGDPYKGDPNAPLVVVEFSDFQCPACQRHALETQPIIDETFVDTGQIMWVFKHLPLAIHPQAAVAAAAAECGGEQGAFFEMDRALFTAQEDWSIDDPGPIFSRLARDLGLNVDAFASCYNGRAALERVLADMYDALEVATQTPTFVILRNGRGTLLEGARDADSFATLLEGQVEAALAEPSDES